MLGQERQHVVEKAYAGRDAGYPRAIKIGIQADLRFRRFANDSCNSCHDVCPTLQALQLAEERIDLRVCADRDSQPVPIPFITHIADEDPPSFQFSVNGLHRTILSTAPDEIRLAWTNV